MKLRQTLIQILFVCIFGICAVYLFNSCSEKNQTEKDFEVLRKTVEEKEDTLDETVEYNSAEPEIRYAENGMLASYYELYLANSDMVGWIKIDGTRIDYPVMYDSGSNAYYLHRNFKKENSSDGIPFMDYQCTPNEFGDNVIIYAHNLRNGAMFHDLLNYSSKTFWDKHRTVRYDTMYNMCEYEIFAAFRTSIGSENEFEYYRFINAGSKAEYDTFVDSCIGNSLYYTGIRPEYGETLLTLSTCSYNTDNERFVVVGRQIARK